MSIQKTEIVFDDIPDRLFIQAVKVRDIVRARPLKATEKKNTKRGAPDILVKPLIGEKYLISRNEVIGNFTYTNGKKIKTAGWSSDNYYVIFRNDNVVVMVMQVPQNHILTIGDKTANEKSRSSGDYVVCLVDEDGRIQRNTATIVSSSMFKKMCYIPNNDIIARYKGAKSKLFDFHARQIITQGAYDTDNKLINPIRKNKISDIIKKVESKPKVRKPDIVNLKAQNNVNENINKVPVSDASKINGNNKYIVKAQIVNDCGKRIGFVIQAPNGEVKRIDKELAIKLAASHKLYGVAAVRSPAEEIYLRAINGSLDNLEIIYE